MALIKAGNIKFCYENQVENLFEDLSFEIGNKTKAGLIGKNGCGKTTLCSILLQKLKPISGIMYFQPNLRIGYLPQKVDIPDDLIVQDFLWMLKPGLLNLKKKMEKIIQFNEAETVKIMADFDTYGGYKFDIHFQKIMSQFDLNETFLKRKVNTLSGGEKNKIVFCRIMLDDPDLLLLDEPTNHLDVQTLEWLESYLNKINIPFIVISHDRKFLDNCVQEIWEMEDKTIRKFSGNYSFYRQEKDVEFQRKLHRFENAQKKIGKLQKAFHDRKGWAASHQAQTGSEGYAPVYETIINPAKNAMRRAKAVETRLNKEIEKAQEEKPWIEKNAKFTLKIRN